MAAFARALLGVCAVGVFATAAAAQRADTLRPPTVPAPRAVNAPVDSVPRAPLTPRRAFLYSLAVPGSAQTVLGRPRTAALFVMVEAVAITMARKSASDLREARRHARDSIVVSYRTDPVTGRAVVDSNGVPIPASFLPNDIGIRVAARRTHFEDWIATLAFNHLLSGAEAFVSAHLWDLPAEVSMERRQHQTFLMARLRW